MPSFLSGSNSVAISNSIRNILFPEILELCANSEVLGIGVIFARIIDAFPPTEGEVHQKISQLLGVGGLSAQDLVL